MFLRRCYLLERQRERERERESERESVTFSQDPIFSSEFFSLRIINQSGRTVSVYVCVCVCVLKRERVCQFEGKRA